MEEAVGDVFGGDCEDWRKHVSWGILVCVSVCMESRLDLVCFVITGVNHSARTYGEKEGLVEPCYGLILDDFP